ncbi:MAG: putative capsid protein [Circoviridae sp.]|nr:MAG: putative capsid protein [Circoviridae sp.]
MGYRRKNVKKHKRYARGRAKYGSKQSAYRQVIPRTIQVATKRNMNQTLKFVINQTYVVDPSTLGAGETAVLSFRANSIYQSHMPTGSATVNPFKSQDPSKYNNNGAASPLIQQNADGWDDWTNRYQHFCVTGSKITYTYEPTETGAPAVFISHLAGVSGAIVKATTSAAINTLPFIKRHSLTTQGVTSGINATTGIRGNMMYSARKFEGVKDPEDNSNLRGRFANPNLAVPTTGATPGEQSFFYLAMATVDPATSNKMPGGVLRLKIEYITQLKEPTETNKIQVVTSTAVPPDEL